MNKPKNMQEPVDLRAAVDVVEKNTDTSWAMFQALQGQQERGFEKTRPTALTTGAPVQAAQINAVTVEWAASHGVLRQVHETLRKLPEERHHIGE